MHKILVMTDIHLRADGKDIIGIDTVDRFKQALSHAQEHHPDATDLILTGDLTHSGRLEEYKLLHEIIDEVTPKVHMMLGNHDNRDNFLEVFPNKARTSDGFIQSALDFDDTCVVMLDSLDGPPFRHTHHSGHLCEARLAWMDTEIKARPKKSILLCVHHPSFNVGFPGMDAIKLQNADAFLKRLSQHPNPTHIISGHVHRTISGHAGGFGFTMYKSTAHQMPMVMTTEDPSISIREPGAYGIVLLDQGNIIAHSEDFTLPPIAPITGPDALPD